MTEQHECEFSCECGRFLNRNEYETLKKATDVLSAEDTRGCAAALYLVRNDLFCAQLLAYANILEGK